MAGAAGLEILSLHAMVELAVPDSAVAMDTSELAAEIHSPRGTAVWPAIAAAIISAAASVAPVTVADSLAATDMAGTAVMAGATGDMVEDTVMAATVAGSGMAVMAEDLDTVAMA